MGFWKRVIESRLRDTIREGALEIVLPGGENVFLGPDRDNALRVSLKTSGWLRRILFDPDLQFGEAYVDEGLVQETGDLYDLLDLLWTNVLDATGEGGSPWSVLRKLSRTVAQFNLQERAARNVAHHYDIGNDLYRLFLDEDMQYSCAYFPDADTSLEDAQRLKKDHIARKLGLKSGEKVLDLGCGWGGLALHLAKTADIDVLGVTLSREQFGLAQERARAAGLDKRVTFRLEDYRNLDGTFDKIVSVGMFEHVGVPHYQEYFDWIAGHLAETGSALVHTIGRRPGPGATNPWIARHIFPGGYIPALSEILPAIEKSGLVLLDIEVLRLHYAETLKAWRERFLSRADEARSLYDDRFVRMWDFYLASSEASFRHGFHNVYQILVGHRQDAIPLTRDYMYR